MKKVIFFDTETTGLDTNTDEIVQIGIIDSEGKVLLDKLVKPVNHTSWEQAERINGISPESVKDAPALNEIMGDVLGILLNADIIAGYNVYYDIDILMRDYGGREILEKTKAIFCCMRRFAKIYGEWNEERGEYKWISLVKAMEHINGKWSGTAHGAVADSDATRQVFEYLKNYANRHGETFLGD